MSKNLTKIISTFFGFGYFPFAPGTMGSLCGLLIYLLVCNSNWLYFFATILILILGFFVCSKAKVAFNLEDPPEVVIDEVAGILISLLFLPKTLPIIISAFILFRGFDTIKIWPTERLEKVPNGAGIMLDDVMAGIYANFSLQITLFIVSRQ